MDIYEDCFLDVYGGLESMQEVLKLYIQSGSDKGGVDIANAVYIIVDAIKDKMSEAQEKARKAG